MKRDNQPKAVPLPFETTLEKARKAIIRNGFLLLHEINPQAILTAHGITTAPLRQLLFFHPQYMQQILLHRPEAVIEAPR